MFDDERERMRFTVPVSRYGFEDGFLTDALKIPLAYGGPESIAALARGSMAASWRAVQRLRGRLG